MFIYANAITVIKKITNLKERRGTWESLESRNRRENYNYINFITIKQTKPL